MRNNIGWIQDLWYEGYQHLLGEARARQTVRILDAGKERRRHPRFPVRTNRISSSREGSLEIVDMSITGVAFYSARDRRADSPLRLSLANTFSAEADVLASDPVAAPGSAPPRYRVRCRFRDEAHGLQFLTLALELQQHASA